MEWSNFSLLAPLYPSLGQLTTYVLPYSATHSAPETPDVGQQLSGSTETGCKAFRLLLIGDKLECSRFEASTADPDLDQHSLKPEQCSQSISVQ